MVLSSVLIDEIGIKKVANKCMKDRMPKEKNEQEIFKVRCVPYSY